MISLMRYQLSNYARTYQYVPPFSIFILCLVVNYTFVPNPILDSFSFTSIVIFFLMGWFTITLFHSEDEGQKVITILHANGSTRYNISLFIICMLIALCLSMISVIYPTVIHAFAEEPSFLHLSLGFLAHFSLAFLGMALSAMFTRELVKSKQNTWWGVISVLLFAVVIATLKDSILHIKGIIWFLPPLYLSLEMMTIGDQIKSIPSKFYWQFIWILVYAIFIIYLFFFLSKLKKN
ncbi:ABC transporter permease [Lysinibacillus sp. FSL K6-0057]|uniref:ABC transporter permease n=1 Tax=unclassified Lysinibacillus TaxID=2636778 RepID=UPI003158653B